MKHLYCCTGIVVSIFNLWIWERLNNTDYTESQGILREVTPI